MNEYQRSEARAKFWLTFALGVWIGFLLFPLVVGLFYRPSLVVVLGSGMAIAVPALVMFLNSRQAEAVRRHVKIQAFWKTKAGKRVLVCLYAPVMLFILYSLLR